MATKTQKEEKKQTAPGELPEHIMDLLRPLAEFVKNSRTNPDDLHIRWEAKVLRGNGDAFLVLEGNSSMPALLSPSLRQRAPELIRTELVEKIVGPIHAKVQEYVGKMALEEAGSSAYHLPPPNPDLPPSASDVDSMVDEIEEPASARYA